MKIAQGLRVLRTDGATHAALVVQAAATVRDLANAVSDCSVRTACKIAKVGQDKELVRCECAVFMHV